MSGLIDTIVRRRRASARRRLGPPADGALGVDGPSLSDAGPTAGEANANGAEYGPSRNGHAEPDAVPGGTLTAPDEQPTETFAVVAPAAPAQPEPPEAPAQPEAPEAPVQPEPPADEPDDAAPVEQDVPPEPEPEPRPAPPASLAEQPEPQPQLPRRRSQMRRRLRRMRTLREVQERDLGGFLVELRRFGVQRDELLGAKVVAALRTDAEIRALEQALGEHAPTEIRQPGLGGVCPSCQAIHGSLDHFCASCGAPLGHAGSDHAPGSGAGDP